MSENFTQVHTESSHLAPTSPMNRWRFAIGLLTAGVLWAAAAGKAVQVVSEPMMADRWFWTGVLEIELALGIAVFLGRRSRWVWNIAGCFFVLLALVAAAKGLRGDTDCGCFGVVAVNPWITVSLDIALATLLLVFRSPLRVVAALQTRDTEQSRQTHVWQNRIARASLVLVVLAGVGIAVMVAASQPGTLQADGRIDGASKHVVLEPDDWVGQPFPLLPYLADSALLGEGTWDVVLARPGCPHCMDYLARWNPDQGSSRAAVISLASPAHDLLAATEAHGVAAYSLTGDRRWYAEVPVMIHIEDGIVKEVTHLKSALPETASQAPHSPSESPRPDLTDAVWFTEDGKVDLGYIVPGSSHILAYRVAAPTNQPLQLLGIHSECPCTTITQAPERVVTGQDAIITMRFVATHKPVLYDQGVLIRTDHPDPDLAERRLVVTARIGLPLSVQPQQIWAGATSGSSVSRVTVTVTNDGPEPIRLIYAVAESPGITAQVPSEPIAPGTSIELPVLIRPSRWDGRPTRLRIPTTNEIQPNLFITINL